jgi:hypothetical protein
VQGSSTLRFKQLDSTAFALPHDEFSVNAALTVRVFTHDYRPDTAVVVTSVSGPVIDVFRR